MPSLHKAASDQIVVCDNGTGFVKCGFAGDTFPKSVFPCLVGRPVLRYEGCAGSSEVQDVVIGSACAEQRSNLEVSYPMTDGIVTNWVDMHRVWDHTFEEVLKIDPREEQSRIMLTNPPLNPTANKLQLMETMFERYGFSALSIQVQAGLALYAQGLMTGLVLDSGDGVTHAIPVVDGFSFPHLTKRINIAGRHITSYLLQLLLRRGYALNKTADFETVRQLKEQACFVAQDFGRESRIARETTYLVQKYTLPDGSTVRVAPERFTAPEALFSPDLIDKEGDGISEMVFKCIQESPMDNRMQLYRHIVLSGGCTMLSGLPARLEKDIKRLYLRRVLEGDKERAKGFKLRVEAAPRRKHMVFLGAAILADIMRGEANEFWVTRQEWQEDPRRALTKCDGLVANRPA